MNQRTVAALKRLNHEFYAHYSECFSSTRVVPWVGWQRVLDLCRRSWRNKSTRNPTSILDVGCGNGRFGQLLEREFSDSYDYLGIDYSSELLAVAAEKLPPPPHGSRAFLHLDLTLPDLRSTDLERQFQLITVLGLLHHIPGSQSRQALIRFLFDALEPGGLMVLAFWQFGNKSRFLQRSIPWSEHNRTASEQIDLEELECGDHLLPWGDLESSPQSAGFQSPRRYCHYASPEESARLISEFPLDVVETFLADGKTGDLNLYYVLRKSESATIKSA